jgi:hypothetical protein
MKNEHDDERMAGKAQMNMGNKAMELAKLVLGQALKDAPGSASLALAKVWPLHKRAKRMMARLMRAPYSEIEPCLR